LLLRPPRQAFGGDIANAVRNCAGTPGKLTPNAEAHGLFRYRRDEGGFAGWVEKRLKMSRRTAYNLLDVHEKFGGESVQILHTLPRSVLYLLAAPSTPDRAG
jgi:hypothetical protein